MRPLEFCLRRRGRHSFNSWEALIQVDQQCLRDLDWVCRESILVGVPLRDPSPTTDILTDASRSGWGGSVGRPAGVRLLEAVPGVISHKPVRNEGSIFSTVGLGGPDSEASFQAFYRQLNSSCVPQEGGRLQVSPSDQGDREGPAAVRSPGVRDVGGLPAGVTERDRGSALKEAVSKRNRVSSGSRGPQQSICAFGQPLLDMCATRHNAVTPSLCHLTRTRGRGRWTPCLGTGPV